MVAGLTAPPLPPAFLEPEEAVEALERGRPEAFGVGVRLPLPCFGVGAFPDPPGPGLRLLPNFPDSGLGNGFPPAFLLHAEVILARLSDCLGLLRSLLCLVGGAQRRHHNVAGALARDLRLLGFALLLLALLQGFNKGCCRA